VSGAAHAVTSPALIENYVRGWTGSLGMYVLHAADVSLRKAGVIPDPQNKMPWELADVPVVKAFVVRYPTMGAQPIQDFYEAHGRADRIWKSFLERAQAGDQVAVDRITAMGGMGVGRALDEQKQAMSTIGQTIRLTNDNPTIPGAEKRQLIDSMYYAMISIAKAGLENARKIEGSR
jgi:hypothetical protein